MVVGSGEPPKPSTEDEDVAEELPFSVELGTARAFGERFAVAGLENRRGANFAFVAFVASDGSGSSFELLRVFGDAEPPALAPFDKSFLLAVASSDAGGGTLRLMRVDPPFSANELRRGEEVTGLRRDVPGFALETSGAGALIAFGKLEKNVGRIAVAAVDPQQLTLLSAPRLLELPSELEAETPALLARKGGYYLAFVGRPRHVPRAPAPAGSTGGTDGGDGGDDVPTLDAGPSGLFLMPLDTAGVPTGSPRELTPPGAHVSAFEVARWNDDRVLAVYEDDPEGPGHGRGSVEAVLVGSDGTLARRTWELGEAVGLPSLLLDPSRGKDLPAGFLVVRGDSEVRVGALSDDPLAPPALVSDPTLRGSEAAALLGGRLLRARSRGTRVELDLVSCGSGAH